MAFFFHYFILNHLSRKISRRRRRRRRGGRRSLAAAAAAAAACKTIKDLEPGILMDIFSRLPFKSILLSRCICPDPHFTSMHSASALTLELFLHPQSVGCPSKTLHWVDLDCVLKTAPPEGRKKRRETNLNFKFDLPGSNTDCYGIVNSCNGLLCLSKPTSNNPHIICNPVTGEYISIPKSEERPVIPGFGYCWRSNKYKVLRLIENKTEAEVYTVGTASWRSIGCAPFDLGLLLFTTYLNGVVHWVSDTAKGPAVIVAFDFEKEQFSLISLPPHFGERHNEKKNLHNMNMGVLGGCLSVCDVTFWDHFDIWVMREYGDSASWTKERVIYVHSGQLHRPIKFLENGDVLMIYDKAELVAYNSLNVRYLKIDGALAVFEAITLVPSFAPLADAAARGHLNVQTIKASSKGESSSSSKKTSSEGESSEGTETLFLVEQGKPISKSNSFWPLAGGE